MKIQKQSSSSSLTKSTVKSVKQSRFLNNKTSINPNNNNPYLHTINKQAQIRKKVTKIQSIQQLKKIHTLAENQNKQLTKDLAILKQHLAKIQQAKKRQKQNINKPIVKTNIMMGNKVQQQQQQQNQSQQPNKKQQQQQLFTSKQQSKQQLSSPSSLTNHPKQLTTEYNKFLQQLKQQYKLMSMLKSNTNIIKAQYQSQTQQASDQLLTTKRNQLKQIQHEIQSQTKQKIILGRQNLKLQQTLQKQVNTLNPNNQQMLLLQIQNKQLKKQILVFKQQSYRSQSKAAKIIDTIYNKKQLLTQYDNRLKNQNQGDRLILNNKNKRSSSVANIRAIVAKDNDNDIIGDIDNGGRNKQSNVNQNNTQSNGKHISAVSALSTYGNISNKNNTIQLNDKNYTTIKQSDTIIPIPSQQQQIIHLKHQIHQLSLNQIKHKQSIKRQKQSLKQNNIKLNQNFITLQKQKTKKISQLNHLKSKLNQIVKFIEEKQMQKVKMVSKQIQNDQYQMIVGGQQKHIKGNIINNTKQNQSLYSTMMLRRDFVGVIGPKHRFDDRMFLKQNTKSFIKGLIIYQNDNNLSIKGSIAAIRAIYTDQYTNLMNHPPIPGVYLQKCKTQRLQLPQDDFLKLIKIKYNNKQTRVSKIQIRSNRNLKYQFGEKRPFQQVTQHEIVYAFDIGLEEFPVGLFGSYCVVRNCWYLESIGVEINTLN